MEQKKRKISIRKIVQLFVTIVVTAGCIVAVLSASKIQDNRVVRDMQIHIRNKKSCGFLDEQQVKDILINSRHISLKETPITQLNIRNMEAIMRSNPWIATSEVHVDNTGTLHVLIEQRVPAFRVFEQDGNSYYIDTTLKTLPLSDQYTHYTAVVTNVPELKEDSTGKSLKVQIMKMVQAISADTFWNAQVSEIKLADDLTFELVPVLGDHRIIMGDTSRIGEKLNHVFNFYKQVLNRIGWNKYQVVNASYRGQIVATPSLPWKPPKDKAMSNMNWVKSIMGSTPPDNSASAIVFAPAPPPAQKQY
jgi:cell division protein FtsQ